MHGATKMNVLLWNRELGLLGVSDASGLSDDLFRQGLCGLVGKPYGLGAGVRLIVDGVTNPIDLIAGVAGVLVEV